MALSLVTAPAVEPVSLDEAKRHLRLDTSDEDSLVTTLTKAAREYAETYTQRALITQTWDWKLDGFPCGDGFRLPLANATSVSSITYVDLEGDTQTWSSANYVTDLPVGPKAPFGRVALAYGQFYPSVRDQVNAVTVRFVAGFGASGSAVPAGIRQAILLLVGHWYLNRETVVVSVGVGAVAVPTTVDALLWGYKAF